MISKPYLKTMGPPMTTNRPQFSSTRTAPNKTTARCAPGVYAFRGDHPIPFRSTLHREFLTRFEFDLDVVEITHRPVAIPFRTASGAIGEYIPDFLLYRALGHLTYSRYPKPMLVEVLPSEEWKANWRELATKWKAARRFASAQGWEFRIYDESRIRDTVLKNTMFLARYKKMQFSNEDSVKVVESVKERGAVKFHALLARHFMGIYRAEGISHIWHLVATQKLKCDISAPLSDFSELWVS